jgi:phosphatidylserine/phosphatidylglycerophosphate/cardiolipin synthase-like enzyme
MKQRRSPRSIYKIVHAVGAACAIFLASYFFPASDKTTEYQQHAQAKLLDEYGKVQQPLFSPDDGIREVLLGLIASETQRIVVASYVITDRKIVEALIQAHTRGVAVEVVMCRSGAQESWSKIDVLIAAGIPVYVYPAAVVKSLMHNKFIVFFSVILGSIQRMIVGTGSYNMTNAASDANQENFLFLEQRLIVKKYLQRFEHLKKLSTRMRRTHRCAPARRGKHVCA